MDSFLTPAKTVLPLLDLKGKKYLQVAHRIIWFREEHPDWTIETEIISHTETYSVVKATIKDEKGKALQTGHQREDSKHFQDHLAKAETAAIGRALANLGYGTQFALELDEGERIVDSPQSKKTDYRPSDEELGALLKQQKEDGEKDRAAMVKIIKGPESLDNPLVAAPANSDFEKLRAARTSAGYSQEETTDLAKKIIGKDGIKDLKKFEITTLINWIKKNPKGGNNGHDGPRA